MALLLSSHFPEVVMRICGGFSCKLICLISIWFTAPFYTAAHWLGELLASYLISFKISFHLFPFPFFLHFHSRFIACVAPHWVVLRKENDTATLEKTIDFLILSSLTLVSPLGLKYSDLTTNLCTHRGAGMVPNLRFCERANCYVKRHYQKHLCIWELHRHPWKSLCLIMSHLFLLLYSICFLFVEHEGNGKTTCFLTSS